MPPGSLIQLSNGDLKPVEDLDAEDFVRCAKSSQEVQIDQSVVVDIARPAAAAAGNPDSNPENNPESSGGKKPDDEIAVLKMLVGRHKMHVSAKKFFEFVYFPIRSVLQNFSAKGFLLMIYQQNSKMEAYTALGHDILECNVVS